MTTLQNIVLALRNAAILPTSQVNAGYSSSLLPPYISVFNYRHAYDFDSSGPAVRLSTFTVLIINKTCDEAEDLAQTVDGFVNNNLTLTPQTIGCLQVAYESNQMEERLSQWGVQIVYELTEDPNIETVSSSSSSSN